MSSLVGIARMLSAIGEKLLGVAAAVKLVGYWWSNCDAAGFV